MSPGKIKKLSFALAGTLVLLLLFRGAQSWLSTTTQAEFHAARVLEVRDRVPRGEEGREKAYIEFISGELRGKHAIARNLIWTEEGYNVRLRKGNRVRVKSRPRPGREAEFFISGRARSGYALAAVLVFGALFLLSAGLRRWTALTAVIVNIAVVFALVVPLLKAGWPPFITVLIVQGLATAFTLRVVLGGGKKFFAALAGALAGVAAGGVGALEFMKLLNISGLFFPGARMLQIASRYISGWDFTDFRGLFAASVMIASMGAVADVAVSVASGCWEISLKSDNVTAGAIWKSGMNIGRDIIATMLNSLVLVFTAMVLPLISVMYILEIPFIVAVNFEFFTAMVASALIASIALVLTVPATAGTSGAFFKK